MELNSELERLKKYLPIESELERAKTLHPNFPLNIFEQFTIIQEELGEVAMALNDRNINHAKTELIQTAAMCMRMIENLEKTNRTPLKKKRLDLSKYIGNRFEFKAYCVIVKGIICVNEKQNPILVFEVLYKCHGCGLKKVQSAFINSQYYGIGLTLSETVDVCSGCGSLENFNVIDGKTKEIIFNYSASDTI